MRQRTVKLPDGLDAKLMVRMRELDRSANWVVVKALERELGVSPSEGQPTGTLDRAVRPASSQGSSVKSAAQLLAEIQAEEKKVLAEAEKLKQSSSSSSSSEPASKMAAPPPPIAKRHWAS